MGSTGRFHKAAIEGNLKLLREANRWEINALDANGMTPVHWAAIEGRGEALELLLKRGGDPVKRDHQGNTALHLAASRGYLECVKVLLEFGSNAYEINAGNRRAVDVAEVARQDDVVDYIEQYVEGLERENPAKCIALKKAASANSETLRKKHGTVIMLTLDDSFKELEEQTVDSDEYDSDIQAPENLPPPNVRKPLRKISEKPNRPTVESQIPKAAPPVVPKSDRSRAVNRALDELFQLARNPL